MVYVNKQLQLKDSELVYNSVCLLFWLSSSSQLWPSLDGGAGG